jgi:hypothetical protein
MAQAINTASTTVFMYFISGGVEINDINCTKHDVSETGLRTEDRD